MAHEDLPIPTFSSLGPVYGDGSPLEEAQLRIQALKAKFADLFAGDQPDLFARSPGKTIIYFTSQVFNYILNCTDQLMIMMMGLDWIFEREGEFDRRAHRLRGVLGAADGYQAGHDRRHQEEERRRGREGGAEDWECE